jgi:hypothetical protein
MTANRPSRHTFSLEQAAGAAPSLAALRERIRTSSHCLNQVRHLIPATLQRQVQAGPIEDGEWCLLVGSAAASTKLRQLLPALQQELKQNGAQVTSIRLKIQTPGR